MTFSGIIQTALPEQSGTTAAGKQWRRRDFILLYDNSNTQYPKTVLFSVMGDNIDKLNIQQGVEYDVEIDFSTRDYNGRTYMSATAWKATPKNAAPANAAPAQHPQSATPVLDSMGVTGYQKPQVYAAPEEDSDLPF